MLTVKGVYDGQTVRLLQNVAARKTYSVLVTFLDYPENGEAKISMEEEFDRLFEQWYADTAAHSNPSLAFGHPAFEQIVGIGTPAVPCILKKMQAKFSFIFAALPAITGENR